MERRSSEKALRSHNLWTISIHVPSPMHLFVIMFISEQGNGTSQWCNCNNSLICHHSTLKLYLTIRIHPIWAYFRNFINRFDLNSRGFLILRIFIKINPKNNTKADWVKLTAVKPWKVPCFEWDSCQNITARPPRATDTVLEIHGGQEANIIPRRDDLLRPPFPKFLSWIHRRIETNHGRNRYPRKQEGFVKITRRQEQNSGRFSIWARADSSRLKTLERIEYTVWTSAAERATPRPGNIRMRVSLLPNLATAIEGLDFLIESVDAFANDAESGFAGAWANDGAADSWGRASGEEKAVGEEGSEACCMKALFVLFIFYFNFLRFYISKF